MGAMLVPGLLYFNPRSREGSDTMPPTAFGSHLKFQSTLP